MPVMILFVPSHLAPSVISEALPPLLLDTFVVLIGVILHVSLSASVIVLLLAIVIIIRCLLAVPSLIGRLRIHVIFLVALVAGRVLLSLLSIVILIALHLPVLHVAASLPLILRVLLKLLVILVTTSGPSAHITLLIGFLVPALIVHALLPTVLLIPTLIALGGGPLVASLGITVLVHRVIKKLLLLLRCAVRTRVALRIITI